MMNQEAMAHFKESAPVLAGVFITAAVCGIMMCTAIVIAILTTA